MATEMSQRGYARHWEVERTVNEMERLTIKSEVVNGHYILKCMCNIGRDGVVDDESGCTEYFELCDNDCESCKTQEAFDRLAAYEDTGLTPEEVEAVKADNDRLHRLIDELENSLRKVKNENWTME